MLLRVSRAAWRLEQAERERISALASARAEGVSIRTLAAAAGLSPARAHQITADADLDELDAALGELRAAGWPAPEDPGGDDDVELDGRDLICDRLVDEADWIRQCAGWLTHLHTSEYPPAVNLRPDGDHPDRAHVMIDLPRVAAILQRIATDVDELARARRVADLGAGARAELSRLRGAGEATSEGAGGIARPLERVPDKDEARGSSRRAPGRARPARPARPSGPGRSRVLS